MKNKFYDKWIYSKSKIAMILRILAWVILVVAIIAGVVNSFRDNEPIPLMIYPLYAAGTMLLFYVVAAILNYLADITDILKRNVDKDTENK